MGTVDETPDSRGASDLPVLYDIDDLCGWLSGDDDDPVKPRYITDRIVKDGWPHIFIARRYRFTREHMIAIRDMHERGTTATKVAFGGQVTRGGRSS